MSPAQIVVGRSLSDLLPTAPDSTVFNTEAVHPVWRENQEEALRLRFAEQEDDLSHHTRQLPRFPPQGLL